MAKLDVNLVIVLIACSAKFLEAATVKIDSDCITNPTGNPVKCTNHINDVVKRLYSLRPASYRGLQPGRGLSRKSNSQAATYYADETFEDQPSVKKSKPKDSLNALIRSLKKIGVTDNVSSEKKVQEITDGQLAELMKVMQRVAIKNNIKGETVNTHQNIKEFNNNDEISGLAEKLRRIAVSNQITGIKVNTNQEINEYNNKVIKELAESIRRLSVNNNFNEHNKENIEEVSLDDIAAVAKNLVLKGDSLKMTQDNDESYDQPEVMTHLDKFKAIFSPFIKQNTSDDAVPSNYFNDEANSKNSATNETESDDAVDVDVDGSDDDFDDDVEKENGDDDEYDDYYDDDQDDYSYDYQSDEGNFRRMTVNNNKNQRRMSNVINGNDDNLSQNKTHMTMSSNLATPMATVSSETDDGFTKVSHNPPKVENPKSTSRVICKTRKGKKITINNLKKVLALLEKPKVLSDYFSDY